MERKLTKEELKRKLHTAKQREEKAEIAREAARTINGHPMGKDFIKTLIKLGWVEG